MKTSDFLNYCILLCLIIYQLPAEAQQLDSSLTVKVIDVGAGLSCVIRTPDNKYMIYDAGLKDLAYKDIKEFIYGTDTIELMVLSHTDADHIGAASKILDKYVVKQVLWTEVHKEDSTVVYRKLKKDILNSKRTQSLSLSADVSILPGKSFTYGDVEFRFVSGFGASPAEWGFNTAGSVSKQINGVSIVMHLSYKGKSVLFTGDAVGQPDCVNECIASEAHMLTLPDAWIKSDVLIAPHHGADNASCSDFIAKVAPKYVIFSAGHKYRHPRLSAVSRYYDYGLSSWNFFRTDRGDNESDSEFSEYCKKEWQPRNSTNCGDKIGDDGIYIKIHPSGALLVYYENEVDPCAN